MSLPADIEAEKSLIGCCIGHPAFLEVFDDDAIFYSPIHAKAILPAMRQLHRTGALCAETLTARIRESGDLENCGGPGFAFDLAQLGLPSRATVDFHLARIRQVYIRRTLVLAAMDIADKAADETREIGEVMAEAESRILAVGDIGTDPAETSVTLSQAVEDVIATWEEIQTGEEVGITTGFEWLDELTNGGAKPGEFWVIAARPSVGKTAFGLNVARHMSMVRGIPVGVFSLEMTPEALAARALSDVGGVDVKRMWRTAKTREDVELLQHILLGVGDAVREIKKAAPVILDRRGVLTPQTIESVSRRWVRRDGVRVIIVDYLQRIRSGSERARKDERLQIAEASNGLAAMAKDLGVPVIALAQINREGGKRDEPQMHDLKGSGDIEQDAHLVGMLWTRGEGDGGRFVGLKVPKHRNGPEGVTTLKFRPELTRFESASAGQRELEEAGLDMAQPGKNKKLDDLI